MEIIGKTVCGKEVLAGIFKLYDTHGMNLTDLFHYLSNNNYIASPYDFVSDAKKAGWKDKTIALRLSEALCDVYGKDHRDSVFIKLGLKIP